MRTLLALGLALSLGGCATLGRVGSPAPAPPPVRSVESAIPSSAPEVPPPAPIVMAPVPPDLPPAPPVPPAPAPTARTSPPAPVPPVAPVPPPQASVPPAPVPVPPPPQAPQPPQPPRLSQQVSSDEEKRIQADAMRRIDRAERLMRQVDQKRLPDSQTQNVHTVQSFLTKAKEALAERDVQRALTLADKASVLADELVKSMR